MLAGDANANLEGRIAAKLLDEGCDLMSSGRVRRQEEAGI